MNKFFKAIAILTSCAAIAAVGGLMACDNDDNSDSVYNNFEDSSPSSYSSSNLTDGDGIWYTLINNTYYSVTSYNGNDVSVIIPSVYNDLPVLTISSKAFYNCSSLIEIAIPDSITMIESSAFLGCVNLKDITIPDSVTYIGNSAFGSCEALTSVTIGDGVVHIGDYAFADCRSLTSVTIPDNVTAIGYAAFQECRSLTSVIIGDGVTSIGNAAFYMCWNLESVVIGNNVIYIGCNVFTVPNYVSQESSLTSVTFKNTYGWYVTETKEATSGTDLDSLDLVDTSIAATYLADTYNTYYWYNTNK